MKFSLQHLVTLRLDQMQQGFPMISLSMAVACAVEQKGNKDHTMQTEEGRKEK